MKRFYVNNKTHKLTCLLILVFTILVNMVCDLPVMKVMASENVACFYVDIANGNDNNDGTSVGRAFRTIGKARNAVRSVNQNMSGDIIVYIRAGEYYLGEDPNAGSGLVFDERDSGTGGHKIIYANYNNEAVSIVGGKRITGWTQDSENIYKAYVGTSWKFYELFENNERSEMARTPNEGYSTIEAPVEGDTTTTKFHFKAEDFVRNDGDDYSDAQVSVSSGIDYGTKVIPISDIDWSNRIITLKNATNESLYEGKRYFLRGAKSFLNKPGEFYLDESTGYVYYWPVATPIEEQTVVAPTMLNVISLKGSSMSNVVHDLEFRGLSISVSNFSKTYADGVGNVRSGLIAFDNAENITVINCHLSHAGYSGVTMNSHSQRNKVIDCTIEKVGHHGVYLAGDAFATGNYASAADSYRNKFNTISGNKITNTGLRLDDGCGVNISQSGDNEISYNEISHTTRSGINLMGRSCSDMVGKTVYNELVTYENHWDYLHTRNNIIKFNDISHALTNTQDGGGIYSWATGKGNVFDNNIIHDFTSAISGGETFGIYLDDNSDYNLVKNNIVYKVAEGGAAGSCPVYIKGIYNVFTNNIIADNGGANRDMLFRAYGGVPNHHITLTNNIIYKEGGQHYYYFFDWSNDKVAQSDYNTYYHPNGTDRVYLKNTTRTWENWKTENNSIYDQNSVIADPLFVDRENHDYTVLANSPALGRGFVNINQKDVGRYKNAENIIRAGQYDNMMGVSTSGEVLSGLDDGDWVCYKNMDFGSEGMDTVYMKMADADAYRAGTVEMRLDSVSGTMLGSVDFSSAASTGVASAQVDHAIGKHDLYFVFKGNSMAGSIDWFNFTASPVSEALIAFNAAGSENMEAALRLNASVFNLDLSYYDTLTADEKDAVHALMANHIYTSAQAVCTNFNDAIASIKPPEIPEITKQPVNLSRNIGESATFTVSAKTNDKGTLSYRWEKSTDHGASWADILGAASSAITLNTITENDNLSRYRCVITNTRNGETASITSNEAVLTVYTQERYLLTPRRWIKKEDFDHIPAGTELTFENGKSDYNASKDHPLWMTCWNNKGRNNEQKVISLDGSNVLLTRRNSENNNTVTLFDSTATPYADPPIQTDNVVFAFRFKCDSAGSGTTSGRFRLMLNGTNAAENYLAQYINSPNSGAYDNRVNVLNGLVYTQSLARDEWHDIQIYINTANEYDKKLMAVYADGQLVPDSVNKTIPDSFTGLTKFSTHPQQQLQLFTGDGNIQVYIDDLMIFEPNPPLYATKPVLTDNLGNEIEGELQEGQTVTATAEVYNNTFSEKQAKLILAVYRNHKLLKIVTDEDTVSPVTSRNQKAEPGMSSLSADVTITKDMEGGLVKSFIWESDSLSPLSM